MTVFYLYILRVYTTQQGCLTWKLECYDLINTVRYPTRITSWAKSLTDVIINKDNQELIVTVEDLGFSDHIAQILWINSSISNMRSKIVMRRKFMTNNIEELKNLLSKRIMVWSV